MQTQLRKGALELCILALLKKNDSYVYEMVQTLSKYIDITEGTVYPLMRRLQSQKWVETYLQESSDGPARKFYRLSKLGKEEYERMQTQWLNFTSSINEFLEATKQDTPL